MSVQLMFESHSEVECIRKDKSIMGKFIVKCKRCNGTGYVGNGVSKCPDCKGSGTVFSGLMQLIVFIIFITILALGYYGC